MSADAKKDEGAAPSKKRQALILVAALVLPLLLGVGLAVATPPPPQEASPTPQDAPDPVLHDFGNLVVNLAETRGQRYLKLKVSIELGGQDPDQGVEVLKTYEAAARDAMIQRLSSKTLADLERPGAADGLRLELLELLNAGPLAQSQSRAQRVFFTEFLIQ